jgi:hypothetical protein
MTTFWPAVVWMSRNGRSAIMGRRKKSIFGKKSEKQFSFSFFSPAHVDSVTGFDEILPFGKKMKTLLVYLPIFNIFLEIKYSRRKFFPRSCLYVAQNLGIFGTFLSFFQNISGLTAHRLLPLGTAFVSNHLNDFLSQNGRGRIFKTKTSFLTCKDSA